MTIALPPQVRHVRLWPEASRKYPLWQASLRKIFLLAAVALFIRTFIIEPSVVPTSSMEGTILVGDHLLLNKWLYGPRIPFTRWHFPVLKKPQRGEIIVFHYPRDPSLRFVKRVVAVGGDKVEIRNGTVYVNNIAANEPYAVHAGDVHSPVENMAARVMRPDQLFVLGDNRDNSEDSRFWGPVPLANVIAEPVMIFWSYDAPSAAWMAEDHRISFYASIAENLFSHTRWNRTAILL
jgi:signal peptidase I